MASSLVDKWIHSFAITDYCTHEKGYTIYKIVSIIFPINLPETLSCVTVWKRFNDVKNLYKIIAQKHKDMHLKGSIPNINDGKSIFRRFHPNVIQQRKEFILEFLDFIAQHPALFKSHAFITFFEASHSPKKCPETVINDSMYDRDGEDISCSSMIDDDQQSSQFDGSYTDKYGDRDQNSLTSISVLSDSLGSSYQSTTTMLDDKTTTSGLEYKIDENSTYDQCDSSTTTTTTTTEIITKTNAIAIDSFNYIYEAALEFSDAVRAEVGGHYRDAITLYQRGIDKLNDGANLDVQLERRQIARDQSEKYLRKLEHIYKTYIVANDDDDVNDGKEIDIKTPLDDKRDIKTKESMERPIHQLEKFKVIDILDSVMQVQDMTNGSLYIMKAIEKPSSNNSLQVIQLPRNVPFMVSLIAYFNTDSKIYLLLQVASGGRLQDYITSYEPYTVEKSSLASLFSDPPANEIKTKLNHKVPITTTTTTPNCLVSLTKNAATSSSNNDDDIEPETIENITPPIDAITHDMDVLDIVNYSKKLLKSVSNTLNESRSINYQNKQQSLDLDNVTMPIFMSNSSIEITSTSTAKVSSPSSSSSSSQLTAVNNHRKQSATAATNSNRIASSIVHSTINSKIPESSIRRWASEIVTAISYLHANDIICMDLHTNNLLLGSNGQMLLSYFYRQECMQNCSQRKISIEAINCLYVAPERPLTKQSDWWSFGVILFELLTGKQFLACHPGGISSYFEIQYPDCHLSMELKDLLKGLIDVECDSRYGLTEIKEHAFFRNINWSEMIQNNVEIEIEYIYFNPS